MFISFQAAEENGRVISLLRDIRPGLKRVGVPVQLSDPAGRIWFEGYERPAERAGIRAIPLPLPQRPSDIAPMLELERLFAAQIDRVLRGANPAETPFLQATTWETIVNLRLARAVGWAVPRSVLLQATQIME
jgi:hypothetical protein